MKMEEKLYSRLINLFIIALLFTQTSAWASKTVNVTTAGTLSSNISTLPSDKKLIVTGVINGTDIKYLREKVNDNKLTSLDLSGVRIVSGGQAYYESYTTEDDVIGEKMFYECSNLKTIVLPTTLYSIQSNAFTSSGLTEIDIPDCVRTVGFDAFAYCSSLTKAVIGKRAKLSQGVFYGSNVSQVYVKAIVPPDIPAYLFSTNPQIYVYAEAYVDYQETDWASYGTMHDNLATYYPQESAQYTDLKTNCLKYFSDYACTTLKSNYQSMSENNLRSAMSSDGLPDAIINMAIKIKKNTWASYEKEFRIHSYNAYSDAKYWNNKLWAGCGSFMGNPTGIFTQSYSDKLYVFVDEDVPSDATLYIAGAEADKMIKNAKSGEKLEKGLNVIEGDAGNYYYILYTADTKSMTKEVSQWPTIKIHIEGGTCDGYFDASRHTDADYKTLLNAASFSSFVIKGKHSVMSIWTSILKDKYANKIAKSAECTDSLSVWEKDLIGITKSVYKGEKAGEPWYLTGGDDFYPTYFNNPTYVDNDSYGAYAHSTEFGIHLSEDASEYFINPYRASEMEYDEGGISHEFGHQLQHPIMLEGVTEGSNDLFANVCRFFMGYRASTGRPLSVTMQEYANHEPFYWRNVDNSCLRMYYSLYLYYHQAQKNTSFYPNLFKALREDRIEPYGANTNNSGLKFVRKVCEVAQEDLTDFFTIYGFFEPAENRYLECYGDHWVTNRIEDIDATKDEIAQYSTKNSEIIFVEDRVENVPTTGFVVTAGQQRWYRDEEKLGECGDVGQFSSYLPENYQTPNYTCLQADNIFSMEGTGGVGFLVYDSDGNLVYASNSKNFSIPSSLGTDVTVYACDANGTLVEVPLDDSFEPVQTVNVSTAGRLSQGITGNANRVIKLIITGNINGTDIKFLRQLLSEGNLQAIDLSGANIVSGGEKYDGTHSTSNNVLGENAFQGFTQLISMELPTSITSIGSWAFSGSGLKAITIPDNVTTIGGDAFSYCSQLSSVVIGSGVTSMGQGVFYGSSGITDVCALPLNPPTLTGNSDYLFSGDNRIIHVYSSAVAKYKNKNDANWERFGTIVGDLDEVLAGPPTIEAIAGNYRTNISGNSYTLLYDGDLNTKWEAAHNGNYASISDGECNVIFEASKAVYVNGITLYTGNDTQTYPSRNPVKWTLYGSNDDAVKTAATAATPNYAHSSWVPIQLVGDAQMPAANNVSKYFRFNPAQCAYKYYRFHVNSLDGNNELQLSELAFDYTATTEGKLAIHVANGGGYSGEEAANLFDGDPDTKWCKGNSASTNWVVFRTTKPIYATRYTLRTGNDSEGRDPKTFNLYAAKGSAPSTDGSLKGWTLIDRKENATSAIPTTRKALCEFTIDNPGVYDYFMLKVEETRSTSDPIFQMSELIMGDDFEVIQYNASWTSFAKKVVSEPAEPSDAFTSYTSLNAVLAADINSTAPIGTDAKRFNGTINGLGHSVTLAINNSNSCQALVGYATGGATIRNLITKGSVTTTGDKSAGFIALTAGSGSITIENCGNEAAITTNGDWGTGGIVGSNYYGQCVLFLTNVYNVGTISGKNRFGGIGGDLGDSQGGHVFTNVYHASTAIGGTAGKFVGVANGSMTYNNCYTTEKAGSDNGAVNEITDAQVASGELCYNLGEAFRQTIGTDAYPMLDLTKPRVYEIAVGNAGYASFVPKTNIAAIPTGVTAYVGQKRNASSLHLEEVTELPADNAFIIKAAEGKYYYNNTDEARVLERDNNLTFSDEAFASDGTQYCLAKKNGVVGFYPVKAGVTIPARKVYLPTIGEAKAFYGFDEDDPTALKDLKGAKDVNDSWFDLNGRHLSGKPSQRGIYIHNGRKEAVK